MTIEELRKIVNDTTLDPYKEVFGVEGWDAYNDQPYEGLNGAYSIDEAVIHEGDIYLK